MAVYKNSIPFGSIVTDGLILNLDATNINSYPGSGTTWTDTSGYNNSGTLTNGPTFLRERGRGSIVFDGVDDRVSISDFNYGRSGCTIASWAKYNATTVGYKEGIVSKWQTGAGTVNEFILGSTKGIEGTAPGNPYFYIFNTNDQAVAAIDNSTILAVGTWYYILGTFDGLNTRIYLNGQYKNISTNSTSPTIKTVASQPIALASFGSSFQLNTNCSISLAQIYNRALSAQEVQQNYNALKSRFGL
jgi:hypothetical protein